MRLRTLAQRVSAWLPRWIEVLRAKEAQGDLSPGTLRELVRYAKHGGHFSFLAARSVHHLRFGDLEDWRAWLFGRGLAPKTVRNVLRAFKDFLLWLEQREEIERVPRFPKVPVDAYHPTIIDLATQDRIIGRIRESARGIFLALRLGVRPGEARALSVQDFDGRVLTISKAVKGPKATAVIRGTKNRQIRHLEVGGELAPWIARHRASTIGEAPSS